MIKKSEMNDKQKARWEEVETRMWFAICSSIGCREKTYRTRDSCGVCSIMPPIMRLEIDDAVSAILNRKDSSGNYLVEMPDPDQSKPNNPIHPKTQADLSRFDCYNLAQVDMDDWIKIIPRDKGRRRPTRHLSSPVTRR